MWALKKSIVRGDTYTVYAKFAQGETSTDGDETSSKQAKRAVGETFWGETSIERNVQWVGETSRSKMSQRRNVHKPKTTVYDFEM